MNSTDNLDIFTESNGVNVTYYAYIDKAHRLEATEANEVCESFGMILATLKSRGEHDAILAAVEKLDRTLWTRFILGLYRSETNNKAWVYGGSEINYEPDWHVNQPDHPYSEFFIGMNWICLSLK